MAILLKPVKCAFACVRARVHNNFAGRAWVRGWLTEARRLGTGERGLIGAPRWGVGDGETPVRGGRTRVTSIDICRAEKAVCQ